MVTKNWFDSDRDTMFYGQKGDDSEPQHSQPCSVGQALQELHLSRVTGPYPKDTNTTFRSMSWRTRTALMLERIAQHLWP